MAALSNSTVYSHGPLFNYICALQANLPASATLQRVNCPSYPNLKLLETRIEGEQQHEAALTYAAMSRIQGNNRAGSSLQMSSR